MMEHFRPSTRSSQIEDDLANNYPDFQYLFVQFLSEHLADVSRAFEGDLQQVLILSVVGQVFLSDLIKQRDGAPCKPQGITASRLADVCGVPRETVRRKLKRLEQKNWIVCNDEQAWTIVQEEGNPRAPRDLFKLDERGIARFARMYAGLERFVKNADDPATRK